MRRVTGEVTPGSDDYESVDRASDELTRRGWRRLSLNEALDGWESFVGVVEAGYSLTIDDYTNDLSIRAWPENARESLTPLIATSMDERLRETDARFRAATDELHRQLPGAPDRWWGRRLPKLLVGELFEDVTRLRLR